VLLMVREAVLLNSMKRLMVAAPIYESTINKWSGGSSMPPGSHQHDVGSEFGYEDVAPHVGAQFAQVSSNLRCPSRDWLQKRQAARQSLPCSNGSWLGVRLFY
jgi:hypothetical protein